MWARVGGASTYLSRVENLTQWRNGAKAQRAGNGGVVVVRFGLMSTQDRGRAALTAFAALWIPRFRGNDGVNRGIVGVNPGMIRQSLTTNNYPLTTSV